MTVQSTEELLSKKCQPCEDEASPFKLDEARKQLGKLAGWKLKHRGKQIRKEWVAKDFPTAIAFFDRVAELAESEDHHPDLHLLGYRNVAIELSTHAIKGLSENDFILAAKINQIPIETKA